MTDNTEAPRPRNVDPNAKPHVEEKPARQAAAPILPELSAHLRANPTFVRSLAEQRARKGQEPFPSVVIDEEPLPPEATSEEAVLKMEEGAAAKEKPKADSQVAPERPSGTLPSGSATGGTAGRGPTSRGGK